MNITQFAQSTAQCTVNGQPADCGEVGGLIAGVGALIIGFFVIGLVALVFTVWMFIHNLTHNSENKVLWALLIFFTGFIGALIYFFVEKKKAEQVPEVPNFGQQPTGYQPQYPAQGMQPQQPQQMPNQVPQQPAAPQTPLETPAQPPAAPNNQDQQNPPQQF